MLSAADYARTYTSGIARYLPQRRGMRRGGQRRMARRNAYRARIRLGPPTKEDILDAEHRSLLDQGVLEQAGLHLGSVHV